MTGREELNNIIQKRLEANMFDVPQYVIEWYNNLLASNKTPKSCEGYINNIKKFLKSINRNISVIRPADLTPTALDAYFISLRNMKGRKGKVSDSLLLTNWYALNSFFKFLYERKYISENYVIHIAKPKNKDLARINEHRVLLNKEDFSKIMKAAENNKAKHNRRDVLIIALFMSTGMRESALLSIDMKDVDFENRKLYVIDKGEKRHEYVLSEKIMKMLYDYMNERKSIDPEIKYEPLFINIRGKRCSMQVVKGAVWKFTEEALGQRLSPHKLRAGFCSILYNEKHDIEFVRRAVGHSSVSVTQRYIVTDNKERAEASSIIDTIF